LSSPFRRLPAVLFLLLTLAVAACTGSGGTSIPPGATGSIAPVLTGTPAPSDAPSAAPSTAAFPLILTDDEGTAVAIAAKPTKIVSLTPAATETLFAIGAGDRVVATDDGSDFPKEAATLPHVATFSSVDVEKIVKLDADLVVAGGLGFSPPESIAKLRSLKIPVLVIYAASVDGVYRDIELVGTAVGNGAEATTVTAGMRTEIGAISQAAKGAGTPPRVYYEVGYTDATGQIFAPADKSFVAEMVTLAGGDAITTGDPASYEIPLETLIERDPQVILLGVNPFYKPTPAQVAKRPGWSVMTAVKNDQIRPVQDTEITRPGPRLATGLRSLVTAIWPNLVLPSAP
jgi:iron complex transport system substrate-binding protein